MLKTKRICAYLLVALLLAMSLPSHAGVYDYSMIHNAKDPGTVHLRSGWGTSNDSLGEYHSGVLAELHGAAKDPDWIYVNIEGVYGYMQKRFLVDGSDTVMDEHVQKHTVVVTNDDPAERLHLRETPSVTSNSLGRYYNGTQGVVLGTIDGFSHIHLSDGMTGYMQTKFLKRSTGGDTSSLDSQAVQAVVNNPNPSDRLHIRKSPTKDSPSLGKYYSGVAVDVMPYSGGEWALVRVGDVSGYMLRKFLAFDSAASAVRSAMPTMAVAIDSAILRKTAHAEASQLGSYPKGTSVQVYGILDDWLHVVVDGQMGYMRAKDLK